MKTKINLVLALALLMLGSLGWSQSNFSFATATISGLKFGTNKAANPQSDIFSPDDKIYIVSEVRNTLSKHKLKVILISDDIKGEGAGSIITDCGEIDVTGESSFNCSVYSEKELFPAGRYKAVAVLLNEDGAKEVDRKEDTFEIIDSYQW